MGKKPVFGRELAEAYQATKPLPFLIESSTDTDDAYSMLNEIILQMTAFESKNRTSMNKVIEKFEVIGEILIKQHYNEILQTMFNHIFPEPEVYTIEFI